jgi:hypothetical protein
MPDSNNELLRHTLATLAYRGARALRNAPAEFGDFTAGETTRQPGRILAHIGDLMDWAVTIADGKTAWHDSQPMPWDEEVKRFFASLERLDRRLASSQPLACPPGKLFQGPIADALTHVGQISMLRRLAGLPTGGENYYVAQIDVGRVGADQAKPVREFD